MFVGEARSLAANTRLGWKGFIIQAPSELGVILQKLARDDVVLHSAVIKQNDMLINDIKQTILTILMMSILCFIPFTDFKLQFKNKIVVFSNSK